MGRGTIGKVINVPQELQIQSVEQARALSEQVKVAAAQVNSNTPLATAKYLARDVGHIKKAYLQGREVTINALHAQLKADTEKLSILKKLLAKVNPSQEAKALRKIQIAIEDASSKISSYATKAEKLYGRFETVVAKLASFGHKEAYDFTFANIETAAFVKALRSTSDAGTAAGIDNTTVSAGIEECYKDMVHLLEQYIDDSSIDLSANEIADDYDIEKVKDGYVVTIKDKMQLCEKGSENHFATVSAKMTLTIDSNNEAHAVVEFSNFKPVSQVATIASLEKASKLFEETVIKSDEAVKEVVAS